MSVSSLDDDDLQRILGYLELPPSSTLPSLPLTFLTQHVSNLLPSHLVPFSRITTPRQRASIPIIKARRVLYASATPPKPELTADQARLRWPLLWERMGGDSRLPPPSANVEEEEKWVEENFLPGKANSQHVKKLGGFLRILEEEREIENVIAAKRAERRFDNAGEEFEEESDEEEENDALFGRVDGHGNGPVYPIMVSEVEQAEVRRAFEKRVLEMFVDGIDSVDYDKVDYTEPPGGDPVALQDREDAYFDDQEPSRTPNGHDQGDGLVHGQTSGYGQGLQNGQGEYDY